MLAWPRYVAAVLLSRSTPARRSDGVDEATNHNAKLTMSGQLPYLGLQRCKHASIRRDVAHKNYQFVEFSRIQAAKSASSISPLATASMVSVASTRVALSLYPFIPKNKPTAKNAARLLPSIKT